MAQHTFRPALRTPRKRDGFALQEARQLLEAARGERLEPLFAFLLYSGLRPAEAFGLRWVDADMIAGTLSVRWGIGEINGTMVVGSPKNRRGRRTFALLPSALMALQRQQVQQQGERQRVGRVEKGLVFAATNGQPVHQSNVNRAFQRVRERAGVRNRPCTA